MRSTKIFSQSSRQEESPCIGYEPQDVIFAENAPSHANSLCVSLLHFAAVMVSPVT